MKLIRFGFVLAFVGAIITFSSCKKDSPAPLPSVSFATTAASYAEDKGTINVEVTLSAVASADVTVNYALSSPDSTAALGADFSFATPSPITIPAGSKTGNISINIIDDAQLDGDNLVTLTLKTTSANAMVTTSAAAKVFNLTIQDNDEVSSDKLQLDLYWQVNGNPFADINAVNLNVYLYQNVKYTRDADGQAVVDFSDATSIGTSYVAGTKTTGFETIILDSSSPDQKYFIYIVYFGGAGSVDFAAVLNGMGRDNDVLAASFAADRAPTSSGKAVVYSGPWVKADGIFDFSTTGRLSEPVNNHKFVKGFSTAFPGN